MTTNTDNDGRVELARMLNDEPMLSATALSLLLGIPVADLERVRTDHGTCTMYVPEIWVKGGRRRTREAQANTGCDDMISGLAYWAAKDHDAVLEIDDHGVVYMVTSETP